MRGARYNPVCVTLSLLLCFVGGACFATQYQCQLPVWGTNPIIGVSWVDDPWTAQVDITAPCTVDCAVISSYAGATCGMMGVVVQSYTEPYVKPAPMYHLGYLKAYIEEAMTGGAYVQPSGCTMLISPPPNAVSICWWYGEYDFGYTWFKQYDYFHKPQDLLDHSSTKTISGKGCFLCCCCNSLNSILYDFGMSGTVTPPTLNAWLKDHGGFVGVGVYGPKVAEYARRVLGIKVGFKRDVPLDEALARNYKVQCSVHNTGHWVSVPCLWLTNGLGFGVKHKILDPMYDAKPSRRFRRLEDYTGVNTNDTRCFYAMQYPGVGLFALSSVAPSEYSGPGQQSQSPFWDQSMLSAYSEGNETLSLWQGSTKLAESTAEYLEDDEDETADPELLPSEVYVGDCAAGPYVLKISGDPNAAYSVNVVEYDQDCVCLETPYSGTLDGSGAASINIEHSAVVTFTDVGSIRDLSLGAGFVCEDGIVTADTPDGFYVQPAEMRVPAVFVESAIKPAPGSRITRIEGVISQRDGVKCVAASDVQATPGYGDWVSPVGVSAVKAGTTFHLLSKVWGTVTDSGDGTVILDDSLSVPCDDTQYPVGSVIAAIGVEENGVFYLRDPSDVVVYSLGNGPSARMVQRVAQRSVMVPALPATQDRIAWALDQQDGADVELHCELVADASAGSFSIREYAADSPGVLQVLGYWGLEPWETVDVTGRLTTLSDGSRALIASEVLVYTDPRGEIMRCPFPPLKDGLGYMMMDWTWKRRVMPGD